MQKPGEVLRTTDARPLWHDPEIMPQRLPALSCRENSELLIVGGGFTGLWAAVQVKERMPDADIVLIEKTFVGDGASGRCGGFLNHSLGHGKDNTVYRFPTEAERLEELGKQNVQALLETAERYDIDIHYENVGVTKVALNEPMACELRGEYERAVAAGEDAVWYDRDAIQSQVSSPLIHAGLWLRGGQGGVIDPARLCWGMKDVLLNKLGVRIYEDTKLLSLEPIGRTGMKANCEHGEVRSDKVLLATNGFRNPIGTARRSVIPVWDYQICTEPLTAEQLERVGWGTHIRHAFSDHSNMFHYFRLTKDNRITWGGGGAVRYYYGNGTDSKFGEAPARYEQLAKEFYETFPALHDVSFSHRWGGVIASSTRFCLVPGVAFNGRVAWAIGYTGLGVAASRFGARVGIELLGYEPSDILDLKIVRKKALPWVPEPMRWIGVKLTQLELMRADRNGGRRGLWLKFLDMLGLGFTC